MIRGFLAGGRECGQRRGGRRREGDRAPGRGVLVPGRSPEMLIVASENQPDVRNLPFESLILRQGQPLLRW